jgi:uracil-DNA glycosylase family protein
MSMPRRESVSAADFIPDLRTLPMLQDAVQRCRGCDLYQNATQAVFGEGQKAASVVFVGEQPGDEEDQTGRPFIGPAGRLLDRALQDAGIDRSAVYVTNAVKHFKFEERGKRRIHKKPNASEIRGCRPWLEVEVELIRPEIIVCLGATAAQTVFGTDYRLTKERGNFVPHPWAPHATSTIHPSAVLRAPDAGQRALEYDRFVDDLKKVHALMQGRVKLSASDL